MQDIRDDNRVQDILRLSNFMTRNGQLDQMQNERRHRWRRRFEKATKIQHPTKEPFMVDTHVTINQKNKFAFIVDRENKLSSLIWLF